MFGLPKNRDIDQEIESVKAKQSELAQMIANLESSQPRRFNIPEQVIDLKQGEHYAGIILGKENEPSYHLILLPGEADKINWADALKWAASTGGALPTRRDQALLYANLKDQFKELWYWSSEQHAELADYAWMQGFGYGGQYDDPKASEWRARAVRTIKL